MSCKPLDLKFTILETQETMGMVSLNIPNILDKISCMRDCEIRELKIISLGVTTEDHLPLS